MSDGATDLAWRGLRVSKRIVLANMRRLTSGRGAMAELSGNAFGHGLVPAANAVVEAGATTVAVANASDAALLRDSGFTAPIFVTRVLSDDSLATLAALDIGLVVGAPELARRALDAGVSRLGLSFGRGLRSPGPDALAELVEAIAQHPGATSLRSLVVVADDSAGAISVARVLEAQNLVPTDLFAQTSTSESGAYAVAPLLGAEIFGLTESPEAPEGLVPAATLTAPVLSLKHAAAGTGVSYGYTYVTSADTTLALVPFGYGDGIDRSAGNRVDAFIANERLTIAGRVAMDASVFDVGQSSVAIGDPVIFFGSGEGGEPTAQEWGEALGMSSAAVVAGLSDRVERMWV